jgi:hypothetical protein
LDSRTTDDNVEEERMTLQKATNGCLGMRTRSSVICFGYQNSTGCTREEMGIFKVAANKNTRDHISYTAKAAKAKWAVK